MPSWVADEDIWKKAKNVVVKQRDKDPDKFTDRDWGLVAHIYKSSGGKVKSKSKSESLQRDLFISEAAKKPPVWAKDADKWNNALDVVKKQREKGPDDFKDRDWGLVTTIYKQMGGVIKSKSKSESLRRSLFVSEEIRNLL